jgi:phenylacetate-CoA ligase
MLDTALGKTPAYRDWRSFDPGPEKPTLERYRCLPYLSKNELRQFPPQDFAMPGLNVEAALAAGTIELVRTNGTSSEAVETAWYQPWWDASERASWRLNGHTAKLGLGEHLEALLGSALSIGPRCDDGDLSTSQRRLGRFFYLNEKSTHKLWTEGLMDRMLCELAQFQPVVLEANPSYLARLCHHAMRKDASVFQPKVVILTYELPSANHLRLFRKVFGCPIASSYGTTESGYVFMQCECGWFHQNTESCHVDFVPLSGGNGGDSLGRLVVTTFANPWRILLRFVTGDVGRLEQGACPCGRSDGLTLERIEGREANITAGSDGKPITEAQLDESLSSVEGLLDYQLIQRPGQICCLVEPSGFVAASRVVSDMEAALKLLYGRDAQINVQSVPDIPFSVSGKYKRIIQES